MVCSGSDFSGIFGAAFVLNSLYVCLTCVQVEHDVNDNSVHCDNFDNHHSSPLPQDRPDVLSPQPLITLTDMSDGTAQLGGRRREQILYSEDFDAIQDYLQNTDSPMLSMSPSWLCRGSDASTVHVFPPTPVNHTLTSSPLTHDSNVPVPTSVTSHSAMTSHRPHTDASSTIESPSLHAREVVHTFSVFFLVWFLFVDLLLVFY